jgi:hypothetical protein
MRLAARGIVFNTGGRAWKIYVRQYYLVLADPCWPSGAHELLMRAAVRGCFWIHRDISTSPLDSTMCRRQFYNPYGPVDHLYREAAVKAALGVVATKITSSRAEPHLPAQVQRSGHTSAGPRYSASIWSTTARRIAFSVNQLLLEDLS